MSTIAVVSFSAVLFSARAEDGNNKIQSNVIGSTPLTTVGGIASGGAPWVVKQGEASVSSTGRIRVEVRGLLLSAGASAGTIGPVTMVGATLVCGGSGGAPAVPAVAVTPSPLSTAGNAGIDQLVTLPQACLAPVVLVRAFNNTTQQLGAFIAATGLNPATVQAHAKDEDPD